MEDRGAFFTNFSNFRVCPHTHYHDVDVKGFPCLAESANHRPAAFNSKLSTRSVWTARQISEPSELNKLRQLKDPIEIFSLAAKAKSDFQSIHITCRFAQHHVVVFNHNVALVFAAMQCGAVQYSISHPWHGISHLGKIQYYPRPSPPPAVSPQPAVTKAALT